jgi:hypothetical protein
MDPHFPWEVLSRLQSRSNPRTTHARSLGREEAFEGLLDDLLKGKLLRVPQEIEQRYDSLCVNRATKHRRRARLLRGYRSRKPLRNLDPFRTIATQQLVERIRQVLPAAEFGYLVELAKGQSYATVAGEHGLNEGNLKSRVCRARARAREVLLEK